MAQKTWVIYINEGAGHEFSNCITESDWFGPYAKDVALDMEKKLNEYLEIIEDDQEGRRAHAMPLDSIPARTLLARYRNMAIEANK